MSFWFLKTEPLRQSSKQLQELSTEPYHYLSKSTEQQLFSCPNVLGFSNIEEFLKIDSKVLLKYLFSLSAGE